MHDVNDIVADVFDAATDGEFAHELGKQSGVDVIGVVDVPGVIGAAETPRSFSRCDQGRIRHHAFAIRRTQPMRPELAVVIGRQQAAAGRRLLLLTNGFPPAGLTSAGLSRSSS